MKTVIFNLGCKVNQYDGDALAELLTKKGHEVSLKLEYADVYVINTCAVTAEAERKSRQAVSRVRKLNPNADIYVIGCAAQHGARAFSDKGVKYVGGTAAKARVADLPEGVHVCDIPAVYEDYGFGKPMRTRSYVKIQDGCDNYCSYCLVPYLRGPSRSRSPESVKREISALSDTCKEIVLTGINLSAYGKDTGSSLTELLTELSDCNARIRLGSLEVSVIDEDFLKATLKLKKFCPHFHLSLQSGDNRVLAAMNRHYTAEEYRERTELIRKFYPDAAITTDIIAGFPTETREEHFNTLKFAREIGFADIHAFAYSLREGTAAAKLKQVDDAEKECRAAELSELKKELRKSYAGKFTGKTAEVLLEDVEKGYMTGYTRNYVKAYCRTGKSGEIKTGVCVGLFGDGLLIE